MNLVKKLNGIYRRLKYGYRANSDVYIKHLKNKGCSIGKGVYFFDPIKCKIDPVRLDYISIGDYTKITSNFTLLAHDYSFSVLIHSHGEILPPGGEYTSIGKNCFIGMNVTVLKGVTIGDNVIIGANSVVTHDLPQNGVYAGSPAKFVMSLDKYYEKRKQSFKDDAYRCVEHIKKTKKRLPTVKELGAYSLLFMQRTEANWEKFSKNQFPGCSPEDVKNSFMNTVPEFENYEDFLEKIKH